MEINSRPERLDPPRRLLRRAVDAGVLFSVDTDAHAPGQLDWQAHGCARPRSAGCRRSGWSPPGRWRTCSPGPVRAAFRPEWRAADVVPAARTTDQEGNGAWNGQPCSTSTDPRRHQSPACDDLVGGVPAGGPSGADARDPPAVGLASTDLIGHLLGEDRDTDQDAGSAPRTRRCTGSTSTGCRRCRTPGSCCGAWPGTAGRWSSPPPRAGPSWVRCGGRSTRTTPSPHRERRRRGGREAGARAGGARPGAGRGAARAGRVRR